MQMIRSLIILISFLSFLAFNVHAQIRASKIVIIEGKDNSTPERNVIEIYTKIPLKSAQVN